MSLGSTGCEDSGISASPTSSGVSRNKSLGQLTGEEIRALCTWAIDVQGGPGERACGFEGQVALLEDCMTSLHGDVCQAFASSACKTYYACALARD